MVGPLLTFRPKKIENGCVQLEDKNYPKRCVKLVTIISYFPKLIAQEAFSNAIAIYINVLSYFTNIILLYQSSGTQFCELFIVRFLTLVSSYLIDQLLHSCILILTQY